MSHQADQFEQMTGERIVRAFGQGPPVPAAVDRAVLGAMAAQTRRGGSWRGWAAAAAVGLIAGGAAWMAVRPAHRADMVDVLRAARAGVPEAEVRAMAAGAVRIGGGS
ncbi:MAG: hypothetical protein ACREJO_10195 [Phycisphaerales bacterium]